MSEGDKVLIRVNGMKTEGAYVRPIARKNRHRVAIKYGLWERPHWVTVSTANMQRV